MLVSTAHRCSLRRKGWKPLGQEGACFLSGDSLTAGLRLQEEEQGPLCLALPGSCGGHPADTSHWREGLGEEVRGRFPARCFHPAWVQSVLPARQLATLLGSFVL